MQSLNASQDLELAPGYVQHPRRSNRHAIRRLKQLRAFIIAIVNAHRDP